MDQFSALAEYYDRFVGADYEKITQRIHSIIQENQSCASLVCDVGCGSGTVTLNLAKLGYDMIGIDGSQEMLSEAMNKRYDLPEGENVLFLCQKLPDFELYGTVDCIISTLDTINYITDENDLDRLFYWFHNYLNPNGLLIFDINTLYKYETILSQNSSIYDEDDVFMTWDSHFDGALCNHRLTIFTKENNVYFRSDEEQVQRYYSVATIEKLLEKHQLKILSVTDDYSENKPTEETQRLVFTVKKGE
jgi:predicted TPR repeat methyltransferase